MHFGLKLYGDYEYGFRLSIGWNWKYKSIKLAEYKLDIPRAYGFFFDTDAIFLYYGRDVGDSSKDQKISYTFPFLSETYICREYLNSDRTVFATCYPKDDFQTMGKNVPKLKFQCIDYDGEEFEAECYLTRQWYHRGTKWCSWFKYIFPKYSFLRLNCDFSKEVGPRKGSWKGGTLSCSTYIENGLLSFREMFEEFAKKENFTIKND